MSPVTRTAEQLEAEEREAIRLLAPRLRNVDLTIAKIPEKRADPFYLSAEWKALRLACLRRDRFRCTIQGCGQPACVADHIVSRKAGGADELANLRSLCRLHDNRFRERPSDSSRGRGFNFFVAPLPRRNR